MENKNEVTYNFSRAGGKKRGTKKRLPTQNPIPSKNIFQEWRRNREINTLGQTKWMYYKQKSSKRIATENSLTGKEKKEREKGRKRERSWNIRNISEAEKKTW